MQSKHWAAATFVTLIVSLATYAAGVYLGQRLTQQDAVKNGVASWESDQYGQPKFTWRTTEEAKDVE